MGDVGEWECRSQHPCFLPPLKNMQGPQSLEQGLGAQYTAGVNTRENYGILSVILRVSFITRFP